MMWKFAVLLLASAPSLTAGVIAVTEPLVNSRIEVMRREDLGDEDLASGAALEELKSVATSAHASVHKHDAKKDDDGSIADDKGKDSEDGDTTDVAAINAKDRAEVAAIAHAGAHSAIAHAATEKKGAPPVVNRMQAITDMLPGDESQKPVVAGISLLFVVAVAFLIYLVFRQRKIKEDQQAIVRRRMLRLRSAAAAATAAAGGKPMPFRPDAPAADGRAHSLPAKSLGKGVGGKAGGKGSFKGARQAVPAGAAGLGLDQRRRPGSTSSSADSSSVPSNPEFLRPVSDSVSTAPDVDMVEQKVSGKGVGKKDIPGATKLQDLLLMLRAVEKIQVMWRRWKANQKVPKADQRITFVCDVLEGTDMPNVNRFGGCDPFIECRIVRGDPTNYLQGDIDKEPLLTAQTDVKRNDMSPCWRQRLTLPDLICEKDLYVQLVLWDYNLVRNQPVGHVALPLEQALVSHSLKRPERALKFSALPGGDELALTTKVSVQFSFWETYRHRLRVASGSWLPKVKMLGTISSYIDARVLSSDPRKARFHARTSAVPDCLWSGRTSVVLDNVDPSWEKEFDFTLAADVTSMWLQLVLWDSNSPGGTDLPIGHAVVKVSQAIQPSQDGQLVEHELRLEELPERHVATDLSRAKLVVCMGCEAVTSAA